MSSSSNPKAQPAAEGSSLKRKRPAACVHCHQRKVRCDARNVGIPCSNCRSSGKSDCRIHEKKKRTLSRSLRHPVPIRCAPLPPANGAAAPIVASNLPASRLSQPTSSPTSPNTPSTTTQNALKNPPTPQSFLEGITPESQAEEDDTRRLERHLVQILDEEDHHRSIKRGVRVIYVGQDVSNINFLFRQQHSDRNDQVYHFPANEISKHCMNNGLEQIPRDAFVLPDQQLADELVDAYFDHVNPGCPIIDEDVFMAQYKSRDPSDPPSLLLLQAILLVGAHVSRPRPQRDSLKTAFFRRAKILFDSRVERNRDILVQAALLLTWYSDPVDDDVSANAHYWVGVAARIATGLGMHRNASSSRMVSIDKRMWRRVWWILVQFDVMVSLLYGRPQAVNLEDCDVQPLTATDFEGCGCRVQIDYVIHYTELCTMISFIVKERFGLRVSPERRKAVLNEADKALANWSLMLPDSVRMSSADSGSWPALLHLTYNNFLILLHRPHPRASAYSDDYGPNDAEICSAAAGVIVSIFEDLREKDRLKYLWISSVNALFTAMIQVRVELRFSNPVLAINGLRRFDSTLASLRIHAEYWLNAETILRLFESSKRLQRDIQDVKIRDSTYKSKDADHHHQQRKHPEPTSPGADSQSAPPRVNDNICPPNGLQFDDRIKLSPSSTPIQHPAPVVDHIGVTNQITSGPGGPADWRQLFSFGDSEQVRPIVMEDLTDMEDEWRELYLHEPGMSDYFQDSSWMQPL
ncbi:acetamidase regulatory protein [Histoplasma capsulatum var. duboisii H88]|uniref:Acetamidase regulatory protein n=2 Tax=Ajellomyces capsulatus TaxID=5037 RepID=F0UKV4_AJEC8|nr:acetamidase regulatory protein [Histoplasma capsulatum H143]EGC46058.1 acetamidase regulatory protein [Histoplasma capsulatum var. duboisii H88]QSS56684.1 acetamidase regulatory protein [Histoplasma capsulatum var. duboisii H88]